MNIFTLFLSLVWPCWTLKVQSQDWLITDIIEINKVQFGLKSYAWFQIEQVRSASFVWSHKYDFRKKLHHTEFNYHFITFILKTQNSVGQIQDFSVCLHKYFIDLANSWKVAKVVFHFPEIWLVTLKNLISLLVVVVS